MPLFAHAPACAYHSPSALQQGFDSVSCNPLASKAPPQRGTACGTRSSCSCHWRVGVCAWPQAEDKEGETPLGAAAQHAKMRDALVAIATGELDISDALH